MDIVLQVVTIMPMEEKLVTTMSITFDNYCNKPMEKFFLVSDIKLNLKLYQHKVHKEDFVTSNNYPGHIFG